MSEVSAPKVSAPKAPHLVEAKPLTFVDHVVNIFHLVIKELRSIRADPVMLLLVVYSFSISVNTVATGAVTEATNLSVGIVDEDGSDLSRQIAEALTRPTFQPPVQITASDIDPMMDQGKLLFVVEIPPNFEADVRAQRKTGIQINVDATAVAQAGNGAGYLNTAIATEIQRFIGGREGSTGVPINLVLRAAFNPNLKTAWFSAMTQVINQITMLTVILTGAALIREREQGTVEHLLVMPVVPSEIMLAKMIANGLVILVAAMLSLQFVVHWWIGSPINGSLLVFLLGATIYALVVAALGILLGTLATTMGQFGLLAMPVLMVTQLLSGSATPMESMPVWLQYFIQTISPTPHFVQFAQAVLFRGADLTLVWRPLLAMLAIGAVYFTIASIRFRKVIFGG
jgi:ABC-2 type transport system permease protein